MAREGLKWFRLELDAAGKVLSCVEVAGHDKGGRSFVYIQAADAKTAERMAWNSYCRDIQRRRRAEAAQTGKCGWCGRKNDRPAGKRCSLCLARDTDYKKRQLDKAAGRPVPALDRRVAIEARKQQERVEVIQRAEPSLRLAVLLDVRQAWENSSTNGAFTRWLSQQIAAASGKKVA